MYDVLLEFPQYRQVPWFRQLLKLSVYIVCYITMKVYNNGSNTKKSVICNLIVISFNRNANSVNCQWWLIGSATARSVRLNNWLLIHYVKVSLYSLASYIMYCIIKFIAKIYINSESTQKI